MLLAGCGESLASGGDPLSLTATTDVREVEVGEPFRVVIVRRWSKDLTPDPLTERQFEPLAVRLDATSQRENVEAIEETREYECFAFSLESNLRLELSTSARAHPGAEPVTVTAEPLEVVVLPSLDRAEPGPVEVPELVLRESEESWWWVRTIGSAALAAALVSAVVAWLLRRIPAAPAEDRPVEVSTAPLQRFLAQLRELDRAASPAPTEEHFAELARLVREVLEVQFDVLARSQTTEQLGESAKLAEVSTEEVRRAVVAAMDASDLAQFARSPGDGARWQELLAPLMRWIESKAEAAS